MGMGDGTGQWEEAKGAKKLVYKVGRHQQRRSVPLCTSIARPGLNDATLSQQTRERERERERK